MPTSSAASTRWRPTGTPAPDLRQRRGPRLELFQLINTHQCKLTTAAAPQGCCGGSLLYKPERGPAAVDHPDRQEARSGVARFFCCTAPGDIRHAGWANATR